MPRFLNVESMNVKRVAISLVMLMLGSCAAPAAPKAKVEREDPRPEKVAEFGEMGNKSADPFAGLNAEIAETRRLLREDLVVFNATAAAAARKADDSGAECSGYAVFTFGEMRNRLGALAMQHYGLKQDERLPLMRPSKVLPAKCGFSFRTVDNEPMEFTVDRYPMGDRAFQLVLLFDSKGKFYRVEFCETGTWRRDEYGTRTIDREKYIADLFTKRFGQATGGKVPAVDAVKTGRNEARYWLVAGAKAGTQVLLGSDGLFQVRGFVEPSPRK